MQWLATRLDKLEASTRGPAVAAVWIYAGFPRQERHRIQNAGAGVYRVFLPHPLPARPQRPAPPPRTQPRRRALGPRAAPPRRRRRQNRLLAAASIVVLFTAPPHSPAPEPPP